MIFQHTYPMVLNETKSQTRRIVKPGQRFAGALPHFIPYVYTGLGSQSRKVYEVGKTYAVQPGRTAKGIARIRITSIRQEDVRNISREDVTAEGFGSKWEFLQTWNSMHDRKAHWTFDPERVDYWINTGKRRELVGWETVEEIIASRPAEYYQAWVIGFCLMQSSK